MIASIISFCTNDLRFLKACVEGIKNYSSQILISVSDHFFNGELENLALLEKIYREFPECTFIEFAFDPNELYGACALSRENPDWVHHWHNSARFIPYYFVREEIDALFFLDSDEVIQSNSFEAWLKKGIDCSAMRFSSYYYFREARFRAKSWPDFPLLVRKKELHPDWLLDPDERIGLFFKMPGEKKSSVLGLDRKPMVHHYSWVRTREEMLRKVACWGHHWERDWKSLIEEEFSRPFNGCDFVRKYSYEEIVPDFNPLLEQLPHSDEIRSLEEHREVIKCLPNVIRVDPKEIFRRDILWRIND